MPRRCPPTRSCTSCTRRLTCATRSSRAGARTSRPAASSIAPPSRRGRSRRPPSAPGWRASSGRASVRASPPGAQRSRARDPLPPAAVVETPLLFEAGLEGGYDATIAVVADEELRRQRAHARGHVGVDERAARQLPQEEKAAPGDVHGRQRRHRRAARARAVRRAREVMRRHERPPDHDARRRHAALAPGLPPPPAAADHRPRSAWRCSPRRWRRVVIPRLPDAVREFALPLAHEDIIRQQAGAKELDPSLLAAVIYAESRLSPADLACRSARPDADHARDGELHRAPVGRHGLRAGRSRHAADQHLLRRVLPALPPRALRAQHRSRAGGLQRRRGQRRQLDRQGAQCRAPFGVEQIPFTETRNYVDRVLRARSSYRQKYRAELGL